MAAAVDAAPVTATFHLAPAPLSGDSGKRLNNAKMAVAAAVTDEHGVTERSDGSVIVTSGDGGLTRADGSAVVATRIGTGASFTPYRFMPAVAEPLDMFRLDERVRFSALEGTFYSVLVSCL
jgi:hypothetical protein